MFQGIDERDIDHGSWRESSRETDPLQRVATCSYTAAPPDHPTSSDALPVDLEDDAQNDSGRSGEHSDTINAGNGGKMPLYALKSKSGYRCESCSEHSRDSGAALLHQLDAHFRNEKFKCLKCRRRRGLQNAVVHGKSHYQDWCPVCGKNLESDQQLRRHIKNEHSRESRAQKNFSPITNITDTTAAAVPSDVSFNAHCPSFLLLDPGPLSVRTTDEAYRAVDAILEFMTWNQPQLLTRPRTDILYELSMHLEDAAFNRNRSTLQPAQHP